MRGVVDQQQRVPAENRLEERIAASGMKHGGIPAEHGPHVVGMRHDHVRAEADEVEPEAVAELLGAGVQQRKGLREPAEGGLGRRQARTVGQNGVVSVRMHWKR